jgi:hypothetical protein
VCVCERERERERDREEGEEVRKSHVSLSPTWAGSVQYRCSTAPIIGVQAIAPIDICFCGNLTVVRKERVISVVRSHSKPAALVLGWSQAPGLQ